MKKIKLSDVFEIHIRDILVTALILAAVSGICYLFHLNGEGETVIPMMFLMAVFLVTRFTNGVLCGIAASVLSALIVNLVFTYPFFEFNFTLSGYPLAITCMVSVSVITSMLTARIKQTERVKALAEKEKMRSNLLRAISHDLRTPLTSIIGASSAVLENGKRLSEENNARLIGSINEEACHLLRMVENLLSITRINDSGGTKINKTPEIPEEVIDATLRKFRQSFPNRKVHASIPDDVMLLPMDAILIEQVLLNLLENAATHSKCATEINLDLKRKGDFAVFSVSDNGVGFDPAALPNILSGEVNYSGNAPTDGKRNMGIGLSLCSTIIKAHGGKMKAENLKNGGAAVSFMLPLEENGKVKAENKGKQ